MKGHLKEAKKSKLCKWQEGKEINILQRIDRLKVDQDIKIRQTMDKKDVSSMQMKDHERARQETKLVMDYLLERKTSNWNHANGE